MLNEHESHESTECEEIIRVIATGANDSCSRKNVYDNLQGRGL